MESLNDENIETITSNGRMFIENGVDTSCTKMVVIQSDIVEKINEIEANTESSVRATVFMEDGSVILFLEG